ncbi:MAG: hypothetical protein ACXVAX_09270, partial [Pseudobdellovibrio sp.]
NAEISSAVSLEEAFAILIKNSDIHDKKPYELVIADIFLEGTGTGLDLWRVICGTYPKVPFLIISSLEEEKVAANVTDREKKNLIYFRKPFLMPELQKKIKEVLSPKEYPAGAQAARKDGWRDDTIVGSDEQTEHLAHMLILKLSLDWLVKQDWVDSPYGGQNQVQDMLYRTRFLTDSFWEDFFFKNNRDLRIKEGQIKEQIAQIMELTPELKEFFEERMTTMDEFFQHHHP